MCNVAVRFLGVIVEQLVINGIRDGYAKLPQTIELYNERYPEITFEAGVCVPAEGALSRYTDLCVRTESVGYHDTNVCCLAPTKTQLCPEATRRAGILKET